MPPTVIESAMEKQRKPRRPGGGSDDPIDSDGDLGMDTTTVAVPASSTMALQDHTPPPWALSMVATCQSTHAMVAGISTEVLEVKNIVAHLEAGHTEVVNELRELAGRVTELESRPAVAAPAAGRDSWAAAAAALGRGATAFVCGSTAPSSAGAERRRRPTIDERQQPAILVVGTFERDTTREEIDEAVATIRRLFI